MPRILAFFVALFALCGCTTQPAAPSSPAPAARPANLGEAGLLVYFLTGTFQTIPQEAINGDSTPARLRVTRVWPDEVGEAWLYFEYSRPDAPGHPFRQRLYRFRSAQGTIYADAFPLPDPARTPFASLERSSLREEARCRMQFIKNMETLFTGGTIGGECPAETPGAANHKSDFYVGSASIRTWERDFDASGKQVSGPPGPWEFRKTAL